MKTRSQLSAYNTTYIKTNGIKAITGAIHQAMNTDIIDSCVNKLDDNSYLGLFTYDTSRTYVIGQGVLYSGQLYICTANTSGIWNPAKWSIITNASRDEFTFTPADIGSKMTLVSGYIYRRTHNLDTYTPKFRLTRPSGKILTEMDLDFTVVSNNIIQLDFGYEIDSGTSYVLIEK